MVGKIVGKVVGKLNGFMVIVAGIGLLALPAAAQDRPTGPDQELVAQLLQLGRDEIATSRLAETRAVGASVNGLAVRFGRQQSAADNGLRAYAQRKNMNPATLAAPGNALAHGVLARAPLANSPRDRFDYEFVSRTVADHQAALDAAAAAQRLARDPELKGLIGAWMVTQTDHLVSAQEVLAQLPAPPPPATVPLPAYPIPSSRTQTGADVPPPGAGQPIAP
jgi:predicted outer membrane protein